MTTLLDWETPHLVSLASGLEANGNGPKNATLGEKIVASGQLVHEEGADIAGPS